MPTLVLVNSANGSSGQFDSAHAFKLNYKIMRIYIIELGNFLDDTTKVKTVFSEQPLDRNDINILPICKVSEHDYFVKDCYVPSIEIHAWTEEEYIEGQNLVELITKN